MCAIQSDIEKTVDALIQNGKPFTAYNVTQILRNLQIQGSHREIRRVVHKMFDTGRMGQYMQELVTLPLPTPQRANLYYPSGVDPNDASVLQAVLSANGAAVAQTPSQNPVLINPSASASGSVPAVIVAKPPKSSSRAGASRTIKRDSASACVKAVGSKKGSCLYIPKVMAKALNIPANGPAYISLDTANKKISILPQPNGTGTKKACVDRNNNIRIGKAALLSVGIDGQIKVEMDGKAIQISKG